MDPQDINRDQYSSWMGLVYVFNLIVGTGALTLPSVFSQAGWVLGSGLILVLAVISYMTVTFIIESMACANAILHWKRIRASKKDNVLHDSVQSSSSSEDSTDENEPLFSNACRYYELDRKLELGEMATIFFNKPGRVLLYTCFVIYLYGDLSIYSAAVSKSLVDVSCTFVPVNFRGNVTPSEDSPCWSGSQLTRREAYELFLGAFILTLGPFVFFNIQKTKYLQLMTTIMRWLAFTVMIGLASSRIITNGPVGNPPLASLQGIPALFGACIYSFMCHHSLPALISPVRNKNSIKTLLGLDYLLICSFYLLLALTGAFAFDQLYDLYTLNFIPSNGNVNIVFVIVDYFLAMFPVFTLSTSFPIIAITLKNNLITLFCDNSRTSRLSFICRDVLIPLMAIIPPILIAYFTKNLHILVGFTGSYAGNAIQYVIPAMLVYNARKTCTEILGPNIVNNYQSPFRGTKWCVFVLLWSITCVILVTMNFFKSIF